jgi:hypothetical protein
VASNRAAIAERTDPNIGEPAQLADTLDPLNNLYAQEVLKAAREGGIDIWEPARSQG